MRRKIPEPKHPSSAERDYQRFLNRYARTYADLMRQGLKEIVPDLREVASDEQPRPESRMDENIEAKIKRLFDWVSGQMLTLFPNSTLVRWARAMIGGVNRNSKTNVGKQLKVGFKKNEVPPNLDPLMHDGKLSPFFQNVVDENVGLIRSIPEIKLTAFKNQLVALITQDTPSAQISKAIQLNFEATKGQANLIARDQVSKLNGALNRYRHEQLGIKRYIWRDSGDQRVRDDHHRLNGKTFYYSDPPVINRKTGRRGNPGDDFQDRCWAEPVLSDIMDES